MEGKLKKVRVRYAPSPTGPLNLGNVRTAFFNWLFAKHTEGEFILRIEDTDRERSSGKYEEEILESLKWLGMEWDEFYRQSNRCDIYRKYLNQLLESGRAYFCFCSTEELEEERKRQITSGIPPKYSGKCRGITLKEAQKRMKKEKAVVRFKMAEEKITFHDLIRGKVVFDTTLIGDIIIAKSASEPLYNFAVVVDDYEMNITHVLRGEDHISNTPKQIAITKALGFEAPKEFVHLPLILGADKKKLSKRDFAKSLLDYSKEGYIPQAVLNFLVLLGWHPKDDREVLSLDEMIKEFSFERVSKSGAVFNPEKLDWFNSYYLKNMEIEKLMELLKNYLPKKWLSQNEKIMKILEVERDRIKNLKTFEEQISFFFSLPKYDAKLLIWKETSIKMTLNNLEEVEKVLKEISEDSFSKTVIERLIIPIADKHGRGEMLWPLRVAFSGSEFSPGPFECAYALGKKESLDRISKAIKKLSKIQ